MTKKTYFKYGQKIDCNKLQTTKLGTERIKRNLGLDVDDVVDWCMQKVQENSSITKKGKNWYVRTNDCEITINANSHTIITAHKIKK